MNKKEIEKKIEELREERNKLNNRSSEIQREIDNLIIEYNDFSIYKDKYISYTTEDEDSYYFKITRIDRLYKGAKLYGTGIIIYAFGGVEFEYSEVPIVITNEIEQSKISIISEEDYKEVIETELKNIKNILL